MIKQDGINLRLLTWLHNMELGVNLRAIAVAYCSSKAVESGMSFMQFFSVELSDSIVIFILLVLCARSLEN